MRASSVREIPLGKPNLELYIRCLVGGLVGSDESLDDAGEVAEWSIAAVSKTVNPVRGSRVRIPASPHKFGQYCSKIAFPPPQIRSASFSEVSLARLVIPEDDAIEIVRFAPAELEFRNTDRFIEFVAVVTV